MVLATLNTMKLIKSFFVVFCVGITPLSWGVNQLLQVSASHQQDTTRRFSGIDGLEIQRLETKFKMPLVARGTYLGDWFSAAEVTENRFLLSGATTGTRRFYRFSLPIEYETNNMGQWTHVLRFAPTYYSDESLVDQTRYLNEYGWQLKYQVNAKVRWVAGIRKDTRFGVESLYPQFGMESRPNARMYHHWVFPDLYSEMSLAKGYQMRAFAKPNGGNWRYLQDDGSEASFGMTDWNIGLAWLKPLQNPLQFKLEVGLKMMGEGSVAGADGNLSDGYFFLLSIQSHLLADKSDRW